MNEFRVRTAWGDSPIETQITGRYIEGPIKSSAMEWRFHLAIVS